MPEQKKQSELQKQEAQLRMLDESRSALQEESSKAEAELTAARAQLREWAPDALNEATIAQARFTTIEETLAELDAEFDSLQDDLEVSRADARRVEVIRQLVALSKQGNDHWIEYQQAQLNANEALGPYVEQMLRAMYALGADRRNFVNLAKELAPGITSLMRMRAYEGDEKRQDDLNALVAELESYGADLSAIQIDFTTPSLRTVIDTNTLPPKPEPFGNIILGACQIARERADREAVSDDRTEAETAA